MREFLTEERELVLLDLVSELAVGRGRGLHFQQLFDVRLFDALEEHTCQVLLVQRHAGVLRLHELTGALLLPHAVVKVRVRLRNDIQALGVEVAPRVCGGLRLRKGRRRLAGLWRGRLLRRGFVVVNQLVVRLDGEVHVVELLQHPVLLGEGAVDTLVDPEEDLLSGLHGILMHTS